MLLKLNIEKFFFKYSPNFKISKYPILGLCFFIMLIGIYFQNSFLASIHTPEADLFLRNLISAFLNAAVFTSLVYFVTLAIEGDMFKTKNAEKLVLNVIVVSIGIFAISLILNAMLVRHIDKAFMRILIASVINTIVVYLFGQFLAVIIENDVKINWNILEHVDEYCICLFLLIFTFAVFTVGDFKHYYFFNFILVFIYAFISAIVYAVPVVFIGDCLAVYFEKDEMEKSGLNTQIPNVAFINEIKPLNEVNINIVAAPVCDVCNKHLNIENSWYVPNKQFYESQKYRQWVKNRYFPSDPDAEIGVKIAIMEAQDQSPGSAVCEDCIKLFKQ